MPDMKYADPEIGKRFSLVEEYPAVNQAAVKEMHRQVGDLVVDEQDIAQRGLLVRHLVLPGELAGTAEIARFLAQEVSPHTYVNVMGQYHPAYKARDYFTGDAPLNRSIASQEYRKAVQQAQAAGLYRFDERRRFVW